MSGGRMIAGGALLVLGVLVGFVVGRAVPSDPPAPPAPIVQPPTGGPNAALLYWRYASIISDELAQAAADQRKSAEPPGRSLDPLFAEDEAAIAGLLRAAQMEHCDFNIEYGVGMENLQLPHHKLLRGAASVLAVDARRLAATGDIDGSVGRIRALLRMADHLRSDRVLIGSMTVTGIASLALDEIERLGPARLDEAHRRSLLEAMAFAGGDDPLGFKAALEGEKQLAISSGVFDAAGAVGPLLGISPGGVARVFDQAAEAWDREDAAERLAEIQDRSKRSRNRMAAIMMPALANAKRSEQQLLERLHEVRQSLRQPE